jgi:deoxyribonuclease-4
MGFMKYIGAHVSIRGGIENAPENAFKINARAFGLFVKNQRRWKAPLIQDVQAEKFQENCQKYGFHPDHILAHDSYLINLGHPDLQKLEKSRDAFLDELRRCEMLGIQKINFHPGSHLNGSSVESCLDRIAASINMAHAKTLKVKTVIENTAGQGTNVGYSFEQLAHIIEKVEDQSRVGICLDTCHLFCSPAGYDIREKNEYERTMKHFESVIGIKYLLGAHVNDSKKRYQSKVDRHALIGRGEIGTAGFQNLMNDDRFDDIPLILETPDPEVWKKEIQFLYSLQKTE